MGEVASGNGLRLQPAQQACSDSLTVDFLAYKYFEVPVSYIPKYFRLAIKHHPDSPLKNVLTA